MLFAIKICEENKMTLNGEHKMTASVATDNFRGYRYQVSKVIIPRMVKNWSKYFW